MSSPSTLEGREIAVPGSIGNLGPGFDTLAVAVQLYLRIRICQVDPSRTNAVRFRFVDSLLDGENLIERAFRFALERYGTDAPAVTVEVRTQIPMRAGLGSSAAAIVAGLRLHETLTTPHPPDELLAAACHLEGHPDNVAAALHGGLTMSVQLGTGAVASRTFRWPPAVKFVVATPSIQVETAAARRVLPHAIPRGDAVFNLQRVALLLHSLQSGEYDLLREALRDRWHQPYREPLVPGLAESLALEHSDLLGVCLSGAGPSIVALAERNFPVLERLLAGIYEPLGIRCRTATLSVHQEGSL